MNYEVYYSPTSFYQENNIKLEDKKEHSNYLYSQCPVWGHRFDRTFVGYSPIDFEIDFSDLENGILHYVINEEFKEVQINGEEYSCEFFSFDTSDLMQENPVIQVTFISSFIWTNFEQEYLWFEFLDHPMTSYDNNFIAIGGWYNIANHPRNTTLALKVIDTEKTVKILKDDPLYRIRFYTNNLNDKPVFIKTKPPKNWNEAMDKRRNILSEDKKFMNQILFDKNIRKQCPFHDV